MHELPPGLYLDADSGRYRYKFRFAGKQYHKGLKTVDRTKAIAMVAIIRETIHDLERGRLQLPVGANPWEFLKTGGQRTSAVEVKDILTLAGMFAWYTASLPPGARGPKSQTTQEIHERHFVRILGGRKPVPQITGEDLQSYINKRASEKKHGRPIKPQTIKKELQTLGRVWRVAAKRGKVPCQPPLDDLVYPRGKDKLPFQTWRQIEENTARAGLTPEETREQWDSLFLSLAQVEEFLEFARTRTTRSAYIYPLLVFAAHTGARKSEMMRSRVEDWKLDGRSPHVIIHEQKKDRTKVTHRHVPLSSLLLRTMQNYFRKGHPGGLYAICRKANEKMLESTLSEAWEWFLRGSKWANMRGYHVFRHSFASNLALKGVDQRVIDELMGHESEAMRRRYRHLFPEQREDAVKRLFGEAEALRSVNGQATREESAIRPDGPCP